MSIATPTFAAASHLSRANGLISISSIILYWLCRLTGRRVVNLIFYIVFDRYDFGGLVRHRQSHVAAKASPHFGDCCVFIASENHLSTRISTILVLDSVFIHIIDSCAAFAAVSNLFAVGYDGALLVTASFTRSPIFASPNVFVDGKTFFTF